MSFQLSEQNKHTEKSLFDKKINQQKKAGSKTGFSIK